MNSRGHGLQSHPVPLVSAVSKTRQERPLQGRNQLRRTLVDR